MREQLAGPDPDARAFADPQGRTGKDRPNIVLILTDDMIKSDLRYMPITRRVLGRAGVTFDQALSPHPLCCPARAAILTGQYAQNNGVKSNQAPYDYEALRPGTALPVWLHRAEYRTAFTGKYLNGFTSRGPRQPGWDYWDATMKNVYAYTPFATAQNKPEPTWHRNINITDYTNHRVTGLIDQWAPQRKPFFIWASYVAPHGRIVDGAGHSSSKAYPPERFLSKFTHAQSPSLRDPAFDETAVSDKNAFVRGEKVIPREKINDVFRSRVRALQAVDEGVGRIVARLRAHHELDNTYLFFTSDNGFLLGEHRLLTKNVPYAQSIGVPMLARGPGIPRGEHRSQRALMIDLAPTFADIANAQPLVTQDGASLLPTLERDQPLRETVLIQAGPTRQGEAAAGWWWRGVTTDPYTYAHFFAEGFEELYDHTVDPAETDNLAGDPAYAEILAELRRRTDLLGLCAGERSCSQSFPPLPAPASGSCKPVDAARCCSTPKLPPGFSASNTPRNTRSAAPSAISVETWASQ
ncbi:MAG TPA: sulfatase, partial [Nocardioides sp.]|nr:sulfatase [Nocardioides sp.]